MLEASGDPASLFATLFETEPAAHGVFSRSLDIAGAAVLILVLSPLWLVIAVWLSVESRGRPFFVGPRVGHGGSTFRMFKFRTMRPGPVPEEKSPDDPRVTAIGRLLRRTSLDELPQLLNVLRGDMTLVGPRPEVIENMIYYTAQDYERFLVRPGMTGLWQTSGRSELSLRQKIDVDTAYVRNRTILLDLKILARTVPSVVSGRGAF